MFVDVCVYGYTSWQIYRTLKIFSNLLVSSPTDFRFWKKDEFILKFKNWETNHVNKTCICMYRDYKAKWNYFKQMNTGLRKSNYGKNRPHF